MTGQRIGYVRVSAFDQNSGPIVGYGKLGAMHVSAPTLQLPTPPCALWIYLHRFFGASPTISVHPPKN